MCYFSDHVSGAPVAEDANRDDTEVASFVNPDLTSKSGQTRSDETRYFTTF
jgi:hypothetical protein